jgi:hypothetical protein
MIFKCHLVLSGPDAEVQQAPLFAELIPLLDLASLHICFVGPSIPADRYCYLIFD